MKKPPLGLMPKNLHNEIRFDEVRFAIGRYKQAGLPIPLIWVEEYNAFLADNPEYFKEDK